MMLTVDDARARHRAAVDAMMDHYDEHEDNGTPAPAACCDELTTDEAKLWLEAIRAEGWTA
jgi:hypothetical protein